MGYSKILAENRYYYTLPVHVFYVPNVDIFAVTVNYTTVFTNAKR